SAGAPRSAIATCRGGPPAVSTVQMPKSRSNAIVLPSAEIVGHRTRPLLKLVTGRGAMSRDASSGCAQRFCAPVRSDTKYNVLASALHIGHASLDPPLVTGS